MLYKTIVLHLLEDRPELHETLRKNRLMLLTMDRLAQELKDRHEEWKEDLLRANPGRDPSPIASEAMEIALKELQGRLPAVFPPDADEPLSLDAAMAYLLRPMPPG